MKKIKVVLVDDETRARTMLAALLNEFIGGVDIVGSVGSVKEAIEVIDKTQPDLVFLDIQMPGGDGFTLYNNYDKPQFEVIFTTAYDKYAIDAIKKSALDYIMKPVGIDELKEAMVRFHEKKKNDHGELEDSFLILDYVESGKQDVKLSIPNVKGFELIKVKSILYCSAASNYCEFHLDDGKVFVASSTLKFFDEKLAPFGFLRVHDSFVVNLGKVVKYIRGRGGNLVLTDDSMIPVSRSRKDQLLSVFNGK